MEFGKPNRRGFDFDFSTFFGGKKKRSGLRGTGMEKLETERKRGEMKARPIFRNEQGFRNNGPGRRGFL